MRITRIESGRILALGGVPELARAAKETGVAMHLVGGAVRDLLLEREVAELDIAVEGDLDPVLHALGEPVLARSRFETARITLGGGRCDLAIARSETYPAPGALPEVRPAPLAQDLLRRDFTVNAMAVALAPLVDVGQSGGGVLGPREAAGDLTGRQLRILHGRSFHDDPTRLLRLVRYAARLDFAIERETRELARQAAAAVWTVGGTRLGNELRLLAAEPRAAEAFELAGELGVLRAIHPALSPPPAETLAAAAALLEGDATAVLGPALAVRGVPRAELKPLLDRLAYPAALRDLILDGAVHAPVLSRRLAAAAGDGEVADLVAHHPPETVALAGALSPAGSQGQEAAARWLCDLRHLRAEITGEDLLRAGVAPGPAVGAGLAAAFRARLEGRALDRESQLGVALEAARGHRSAGG